MSNLNPVPDVAIVSNKRAIRGLSKPVRRADFRPQTDASTGDVITIRTMLLLAIGAHQCSPVEAIRLFAIATMLHAAPDEVEIDRADHTMLKEIVEKNPAKWGALLLAQVYEALL